MIAYVHDNPRRALLRRLLPDVLRRCLHVQIGRQWEAAIMEGSTAIVTPGISRGESLMKDTCLNRGFPLIHLQKEPIGRYWKPELKRFEACARGSLLILAPWELDKMEPVNGIPQDSDYSRFHNSTRWPPRYAPSMVKQR